MPTDDDVDAVLHYAAAEARVHGCGLRLVHAHSPGAGDHADDVLRRAAAVTRLLAGPSVRISVRRVIGAPVEAVLATSGDALAVVLRNRDSLHLLRTLTAGVTGPPVARVPSDWSPRVRDPRPVLLGIEDPLHATSTLSRALEIASIHRTGLQVMHAWHFAGRSDPVIDRQIGSELSDSLTAALRRGLERCRQTTGLHDVPVELEVRHGSAAEVLMHAASEAQVLLLGRNCPSVDGSIHFGRTTRAALHESPCPVVLLAAEPGGCRVQLPGMAGPMHLPSRIRRTDARGGRRATARSWSWTPPKASPGPVDV
ncbi:universal stress protein [Nocardioides endophyticus]|uniref:Universal stress protein n=1 Tax=Nocardioides endophyticus TaxID=1353775 RepID=A0ABP8Z1K4_9ACTN